ncbi:MAG TPA: hypothetical protein DDY86_07055 [Syntrophaceae bacterium]|nr:hypothetical protein [Syntrophaceae bacterium]
MKKSRVKDLKPAPYNPRTITEEKLAALGKSMREFGDLSGVVMNIQTGNLVGGHQRMKHFDASWPIKKRPHKDAIGTVSLGEIETPFGVWSYREVDWPDHKEKAANIAANKHGGGWDNDKLAQLLEEIKVSDIDLDLTGFDACETDQLLKDIANIEPSPLQKNFMANYGGSSDDHEHTQEGSDGGKYPLTFILDQSEWEAWEAAKVRIKIKQDKAAFIKMIGGKDA